MDLISLTTGDTDRLLALLSQMPDEAQKWSMAPYRREWVERWLNTPTLIHFAAEHAGEIVGFVCIEEGSDERNHCGCTDDSHCPEGLNCELAARTCTGDEVP